MREKSYVGVYLTVNAREHHLPAISTLFFLLSVVGHFYDIIHTIRTKQKHIYCTVRVWLCFHKLLKPHATTLHTNYKHKLQQKLRGSTLQFGFGFFKASFVLLASSGFLFLFLESLLKNKAEVGV